MLGFGVTYIRGLTIISLNKPESNTHYKLLAWCWTLVPPKLFVSLQPKSEGNIGMVRERPCVHPGFTTIIWKSNHSINFKSGVGICWASVQNWFALGRHWPKFGHLVAKKRLKMGQNFGFWPLSEKVFKQSHSNLVCTLVEWVFKTNSLLGLIGQILTL